MAPAKPYQLTVLSSDSEPADFDDDFDDIIFTAPRSLTLRQRGTRSHARGFARTSTNPVMRKSSIKKFNIEVPRSQMVEDLSLGHTYGEADDEDEGEPISKEPADAPEKPCPLSPGSRGWLQQRRSSVERRPRGRFWLDAVEIPLRQLNYENSPESPMAHSGHQHLLLASASRQSVISSYFKRAPDQGSQKSLPSRKKMDDTAPGTAAMSGAPTDNHNLSSVPGRLRSARKLVNKPQPKTRLSSSSSDAIVFDPSDVNESSSWTSSYVDLVSESHDSLSDMSQDSQQASPDAQSVNSFEEDGDSEESKGVKRKRGNAQENLQRRAKTSLPKALGTKPRKLVAPGQENIRNRDSWNYKPGIDSSLAPLHDIGDIFYDMTSKGRQLGLEKALAHLGMRKLKVATMCSGTESPILALDLVSESLKKQGGLTLAVEHQFSAEIVPFKQAYIERNFSPPIIFRDIRELAGNQEATTAYGSKATIPGDIDLLVAGFSCVDFSNLNGNKQKIDTSGESGDTFRAVFQYAKEWRPALIVLENVCSAPWTTIQEAWEHEEAGYAAEFLKLDTKQYYIPHTRQRGYMLCVDRKKYKKAAEIVKKWKDSMLELRRPASSPIEAFLLDEDDPRVHRAREELAGGLIGEDRAPRDVDWARCQGRHQDYRADLALGSKRPLTGWEDNGSCKMPDYAWADWGVKQVERIWDTLEISWLRNARRGFDSQYKTRIWELSQNIDRFTDNTPFGITGCITPTGYPYITNRGGPMIGLEALSMQGLPIEKLLLTRENQKQLQDLAGNAMTSTVVGAAIIGALSVGYGALEKGNGDAMVGDSEQDVSDHIYIEESLLCHNLDLTKRNNMPVASLLSEAKRSSRLCLCEGRVSMTSKGLQRCKKCGHTTCLKCGGNLPHKYELLTTEETSLRLAPIVFENMLKEALPMRVSLHDITVEVLNDLERNSGTNVTPANWKSLSKALPAVLGAELRFHSIKRAQVWSAIYDSPHSRMELVLHPTHAHWSLFAKPSQDEPGGSRVRELLHRPIARMTPMGDDLLTGSWQFCLPATTDFKIKMEGVGQLTRSWESRLGLQDPELAGKQVWSAIRVTIEDKSLQYLDLDITGDYELLEDCGKASGSLHRRKGNDSVPLFLFLDPTRLGDPKDDCFVFSTDIRRLNYGETRQIVAKLDSAWRPSAITGVQTVQCHVFGHWLNCEATVQPVVPIDTATFEVPPPTLEIDFKQRSCHGATSILSCHVPLAEAETSGWQRGPWVEVARVNEQAFFRSFAWLTERVRQIKGLEIWKEFNLPQDLARCQRCAPNPPPVKWKIQSGKLTPYEDPQKAGPYERALKDRPSPFVTQVRINDENVGELRVGLNILTLAHRALSLLPTNGLSSDIAASWHLSTDYVALPKVPVPRFVLGSNKLDPGCSQPPNFRLTLRPEQIRSLNWMQHQESPHAPSFVEEEIEEAILPHLGWRAQAKATRNVSVRGGVLADQVGYGKTAITLGLIDAQSERDKTMLLKDSPGKIPIKATLVVVPGHLVNQWKAETSKFLKAGYKVTIIRSQRELTLSTIREFQNSDIIIAPWNLFNNETYLTNVAHFAALPEMPSASGRAFDAWFDFAAKRIAEHVDLLRADGAESLRQTINAKLVSTLNDKELTDYIPSKRLRGAAYRAAQGSGSKAKGPQKKKLKTEHGSTISDADTSSESAIAPKPAAKRKEGESFNLSSAAVKRDWTCMKCPLFQMFHFNRLVIDEYTYLDGKNHTCITQLQANFRWVLSGTPPLGDFADVKTIAVFLGINLGIDDDTSTVLKVRNFKMIQKDRTDVEKFQAFKQARSSAWHQRRHEVAQQFLNQFVRQNIAEIDEIPFVEYVRPVVLPAAERAIYMELNQHLMAQDMRIRKGRARFDNDRERRLNQVLGESKTPEEALIKRCSHFTLENVAADRENAIQACETIVKERQIQHADLVCDLKKSLKQAVLLKNECGCMDVHYQWWKEGIPKNTAGDLEATRFLQQLVEEVTQKYKVKGKGSQRAKASKNNTAGKQAVGDSSFGRGVMKNGKPITHSDTDIDTGDSIGEQQDTVAEKVQTLRNMAGHLRRLATELTSRTRSLRFFDVVRQLQLARSGIATSAIGQTCSRCKKEAPSDALSVLTLCGHTACNKCLVDFQRNDECVVVGCNAAARKFNIVKAQELGEEDEEAKVGRHYGRKLEAVISMIKHEIPKEDQVILFVQFEDLMQKVSEALEHHGITHHCLNKKARAKAAAMMTDFQNETTTNKKKALMLNLSDESASGVNLTNANHVIFLSPLLVPTQYQYDSAITQAIGRARRYGQKKIVHIYRFLSLKTIDVDIIEERTGKMLVKENGGFNLRKVTDAERGDLEAQGGGAVRSQTFSDSE